MRDQSKLHQFKSMLRWVGVPLLLAGLISWGVAPAYPAHAQQAEAAKQTGKADKADGSKPASNEELQKLNEKLEKLEEATKQNYLLALDGERKQVDWWLTLLGVLAAIMAIAGGLIPYLMARKDKEIIEQDKTQIKATLEEIRGMKETAGQEAQQIRRRLEEAGAILNSYNSKASSEEVKEDGGKQKIRDAVATVEKDETADYRMKLRADAVEASEKKQAARAYRLWAALAELDASDMHAVFNAGYWAHELGDQAEGQEKLPWLRLAGQCYEQLLALKPDSPEAACNWGIALAAEASAVSESDLLAARGLWKQAGEKYQQTLTLKPDDHGAAYNWGIALAAEARAVRESDLLAARRLWKQAGEKYQQAFTSKPDKYEAANNWGVALATEARAVRESDLPAARGLWQQAGEKYRQTLTLKPDDLGAACNWGNALDAEARAVCEGDLPAARKLWQQAGEKYRQALTNKPDYHEAANNWSSALASEASAVAQQDVECAKSLQEQAEELLLAHAEAAPDLVAYNLACVYGLRADVQSCLKWLKVAQEHKSLESCEHMRKDKDLDSVRNDPAFIEWFQQVCPS